MTIDPKLKEAIAEKIKLARREMEENPGLKVKLEKQGQKMSLAGDRKCPKNALLILVERKLRKQRIWKALRIDLVSAALWDIIRDFERKQAEATSKAALSAARERQLSLFPGFESLPTRIRTGASFRQFHEVPVPQFLDYETKYRLRAQRDHQRAEELQRLAAAVTPYKGTDLTVAEAFERAQAQTSKVVVLAKKG